MECLITGFKSGNCNTFDHDDCKVIETIKNTVKTKNLNAYDLAKQDFLYLKEITGDGLCIAQSFSKHFKLPLDQVLDQLYWEFWESIDIYASFLELTKENILGEVYSYVTEKCYNSSTGDLFLEGFPWIYECKVIVIDSDEDIDDLVIGEENMEKVIRLHRSKEHFSLLVNREEYISFEQEEVAVDNSRIPKCW